MHGWMFCHVVYLNYMYTESCELYCQIILCVSHYVVVYVN